MDLLYNNVVQQQLLHSFNKSTTNGTSALEERRGRYEVQKVNDQYVVGPRYPPGPWTLTTAGRGLRRVTGPGHALIINFLNLIFSMSFLAGFLFLWFIFYFYLFNFLPLYCNRFVSGITCEELEGTQKVHISAKWIFYSFYIEFGREMVPHCNRVSISSRFRNNGPDRYWHSDLDLSRSRDVIDDVIIRFAIGHFLLVVNWYQVSVSNRFRYTCI